MKQASVTFAAGDSAHACVMQYLRELQRDGEKISAPAAAKSLS
jgi:hypothetical protein